jgi:hypothetical protein
VRDSAALKEVQQLERQAWCQLWSDVASTLRLLESDSHPSGLSRGR